jgi:hypothetical protein
MADATVSISVTDVQPVATFIAEAGKAEAHFRGMTADECAALPDKAVTGFMVLQYALANLGRISPQPGGGGQ